MNRSVALRHLRPTAVIITALMLAIVGWLASIQVASAGVCDLTAHAPVQPDGFVWGSGDADCAAPNDHSHTLNVALKVDRNFLPDTIVHQGSIEVTTTGSITVWGCDGGTDDYYTEVKIDGGQTTQSARVTWFC